MPPAANSVQFSLREIYPVTPIKNASDSPPDAPEEP